MSVNIELMKNNVVIIGSLIVGMTIPYQLLNRKLSKDTLILEKENQPGKNTPVFELAGLIINKSRII